MKKLFFLGLTCAFCCLTSCKDTTTTASSADNGAADKAMANNREVYKAIETGDYSKLDSIIAKDGIDHSGGMDGTMEVTGIDNIKKEFTEMKQAFSSIHFDVTSEAVNGDYLFALYKFTATTSANPGPGMPANQKMEMNGVDVLKMKDGKFTDHWQFNDPKDMKKMMGGMAPADKMGDKMAHKDSTK
jgi:ketosteroid isomerase-like protein